MDFIENLRAVGGVKPCINAENEKPWHKDAQGRTACAVCHGRNNGQVLDLAPLLAKPKELGEAVGWILNSPSLGSATKWDKTGLYGSYVVGPQRASNLIYEMARQLGGTAVVAISVAPTLRNDGYLKLSLPIPPDATVLFVTDKVNMDEMQAIINLVAPLREPPVPPNALPYVLSLVSSVKMIPTGHVGDIPGGNGYMALKDYTVISLHQEKL